MKEQHKHSERREVQSAVARFNQRRVAATPEEPMQENRLAYDFSQVDFSRPEMSVRLGRAYAILLERARRRLHQT